MSKIIGYSISIVGLAIIALSKQISSLSFLASIPKISAGTVMAGVILVIVGIAIAMMNSSSSSGNVKHASEEVPIYEGVGKNRKIVGYHRAK